MVYNAMKLFMEVNPSLFDECSNQYREEEENKVQAQRERDARWDRLKMLADQRQNGQPAARGGANGTHADPLDKLSNFDKLRIGDESSPSTGTVR